VLEAINETIEIARKTGVSTQISHLKMALPANWYKIDEALESIEKANEDGIPILADRYPYTAASTGLGTFFPEWARAGSTDDFIKRLKDPDLDSQFRAHLKKAGQEIETWKNVRISEVVSEKNKACEGMDIVACARHGYRRLRGIVRETTL
jgi:N-acyl-D-amino-acid deacylase